MDNKMKDEISIIVEEEIKKYMNHMNLLSKQYITSFNEMDKKNHYNESLFEMIDKLADARIKQKGYSLVKEGRIIKHNNKYSYQVEVNGLESTAISINDIEYKNNDLVFILYYKGNPSFMYILGTYHNVTDL